MVRIVLNHLGGIGLLGGTNSLKSSCGVCGGTNSLK